MILTSILGHLGRDAEVKAINDKQYLLFSVASTEKRNNEEVTTWVSVLYPYQELLLPYLKKGQQVFVSGKLKAGIYQSQNTFGIDLSVFAQTLQLCGGKKEETTVPAASPAGSTVSGGSPVGNQEPTPPFPAPEEEQKDDLPF